MKFILLVALMLTSTAFAQQQERDEQREKEILLQHLKDKGLVVHQNAINITDYISPEKMALNKAREWGVQYLPGGIFDNTKIFTVTFAVVTATARSDYNCYMTEDYIKQELTLYNCKVTTQHAKTVVLIQTPMR